MTLMAIVGLLDYRTGRFLSFSLFYLVPTSFVAWLAGRGWGLFVAACCAATSAVIEHVSGVQYPHWGYLSWNAAVPAGFFAVTTLLLAALHRSYRHQRALARTDALTGAANRTVFMEALGLELARLSRTGRPFTVAYLDLDHFKRVNDTLGHAAGDAVLCATVATMTRSLRPPALVARMGGDEFAMLMPETSLAEARGLVTAVTADLDGAMKAGGWAVTCSMGVVAVDDPALTPDEALRRADELALGAKRAGKARASFGDR